MQQLQWFLQKPYNNALNDNFTFFEELKKAVLNFNEKRVAEIVHHNPQKILNVLRRRDHIQQILPHVANGEISPTLWRFAQENHIFDTTLESFVAFCATNQLYSDQGVGLYSQQFLTTWLEDNKVLENASLDALSYFYFSCVHHKSKQWINLVETHPKFSQITLTLAQKFFETHKSRLDLPSEESFEGKLYSMISSCTDAELSGAALLKLFHFIDPSHTNRDTSSLRHRDHIMDNLLSKKLFSPSRRILLQQVLTDTDFAEYFQNYLRKGVDAKILVQRWDRLPLSPKERNPKLKSVSDFAAMEGRWDVLCELNTLSSEDVSATLRNAVCVYNLFECALTWNSATIKKMAEFFTKTPNGPADKDGNTLAHYLVAIGANRFNDPVAVAKLLYGLFPDARQTPNAQNITPVDLLTRYGLSAKILLKMEDRHVAQKLKHTTAGVKPSATQVKRKI